MAVPPTSPKAILRQVLKDRRQVFVSQLNLLQRSDWFSDHPVMSITSDLIAFDLTVAAYHALGDEIDPARLLDSLAQRGNRLALPRVEGARGTMRFLSWKPGDRLEPGPFGLQQPSSDAPEVKPDVILTPLLGFDQAFHRIGYGAGHYDRAFVRFPDAHRIGLAWSVQACKRVPVDPWDIPLHAVMTEKKWIAR